MIFDTHAHYDDKAFDEDRDELLGMFGCDIKDGCDSCLDGNSSGGLHNATPQRQTSAPL